MQQATVQSRASLGGMVCRHVRGDEPFSRNASRGPSYTVGGYRYRSGIGRPASAERGRFSNERPLRAKRRGGGARLNRPEISGPPLHGGLGRQHGRQHMARSHRSQIDHTARRTGRAGHGQGRWGQAGPSPLGPEETPNTDPARPHAGDAGAQMRRRERGRTRSFDGANGVGGTRTHAHSILRGARSGRVALGNRGIAGQGASSTCRFRGAGPPPASPSWPAFLCRGDPLLSAVAAVRRQGRDRRCLRGAGRGRARAAGSSARRAYGGQLSILGAPCFHPGGGERQRGVGAEQLCRLDRSEPHSSLLGRAASLPAGENEPCAGARARARLRGGDRPRRSRHQASTKARRDDIPNPARRAATFPALTACCSSGVSSSTMPT